ncbi:MAG: hypothetical protein H0T60_08040 [Acidobacteria bacterium]|nr:hypothetical protein [Acidobacteriota bacterium]
MQRADEAHAALTAAHKDALLELGELRATIRFQKLALEERERQAAELRADRDRAREERDQSRAENKSLKRENRVMKLILIVEGISRVVNIFR